MTQGYLAGVAGVVHPPGRNMRNNEQETITEMSEQIMKETQNGSWGINGDNYRAIKESSKVLPAGYYTPGYSDQTGPFLAKKEIKLDKFYKFDDPDQKALLQKISNFWSCEQSYKDYGFTHKRGILLMGPPGAGKTSTIIRTCDDAIADESAIVVIAELGKNQSNSAILIANLSMLRSIEKERKIIVIMEDIEEVSGGDNLSTLLALLDGELSLGNCLFIATTNYPELIDNRIIKRPRRFDDVMVVNHPSMEVRSQYFNIVFSQHETEINQEEIQNFVKASDGWGFAGMAELVIAVKCLKQGFLDSVDRISRLYAKKPFTSDDFSGNKKIGLA